MPVIPTLKRWSQEENQVLGVLLLYSSSVLLYQGFVFCFFGGEEWTGSHWVAYAGLRLTEFYLPLPLLSSGIKNLITSSAFSLKRLYSKYGDERTDGFS